MDSMRPEEKAKELITRFGEMRAKNVCRRDTQST